MGNSKLTSLGVIVVYELGSKKYITNFENVRLDEFLRDNRRKPIIPNEWTVLAIGIGTNQLWKYYVEMFGIE